VVQASVATRELLRYREWKETIEVFGFPVFFLFHAV
jgi:hypothetical protein